MVPCVGNAGLGRKPQPMCLCECEALATLSHIYLRYFLLEPEDIRGLIWGQFGTSLEGQGCHDLDPLWGHKGSVKAYVYRDRKGSTHTYSLLNLLAPPTTSFYCLIILYSRLYLFLIRLCFFIFT
jgi:hypothetical protein